MINIKYVPVAEWTMEKLINEITAIFAATKSGDFLAPQLIYKGTTRTCLPTARSPDSWHVTYAHNQLVHEVVH